MTAERGPQIDIRLAARNAEVMDLANMGATVTGPMRIVSDGVGGTIAGRLRVDARALAARRRRGRRSGCRNIRTREINLPPDIAPAARAGARRGAT